MRWRYYVWALRRSAAGALALASAPSTARAAARLVLSIYLPDDAAAAIVTALGRRALRRRCIKTRWLIIADLPDGSCWR